MALSALRTGVRYSKQLQNIPEFLINNKISNPPASVILYGPFQYQSNYYYTYNHHHHHHHHHLAAVSLKFYSKQTSSKYQSESESDSDLETLGHRGETPFWRQKIRTFHGILDVNKDGVISFDDFQLLGERFVQLGHLSKDNTKQFRHVLKDLWEKRWGEITPYVTVEQFLDDMHHVLNDKKLVRHAHSFLPYLFKAVDKDGNGEITVNEFKLFFKCLRLDEDDAVVAFKHIDTNGDGKITLKEFVKEGRDFFLTEDANRMSKYFWGPLVEH